MKSQKIIKIIIQTNFCNRVQKLFLYSFQKDDFSALWENPWVTHRLGLMEGHSFFLYVAVNQKRVFSHWTHMEVVAS